MTVCKSPLDRPPAAAPLPPWPSALEDGLERLRDQVAGTTIDPITLLSTDYFNHVNAVIMLLPMLADMPDLVGEVLDWRPISYEDHFRASGLAFAALAIECYQAAPPAHRLAFDDVVSDLALAVAAAQAAVQEAGGDPARIAAASDLHWPGLQALVDRGSAIVHGRIAHASLDQSAVDDLF